MVTRKFVHHFEIKTFLSQHVCGISYILERKLNFLFIQKPFLMDKTRKIGQKRLLNQLILFFLNLQKVCQISIQSDNSIDSYRVHRRRTDRHRQFVKTVFSDSGGLKT